MTEPERAELRRRISVARRQIIAEAASAYLSLERVYPQLAPVERIAAAPEGHGLQKTYKKGCHCLWCREAARVAKAAQRARQRAVA